jgi:hypothetical protein
MQVIVHILKAYKENNIKKTRIHEYILSLFDSIWEKPWFNVLVAPNCLIGGPPEFMKSKLATGRVYYFAVIIIELKFCSHLG